MLVLGIDDAGRGPVIGPMILAGVLVEAETEKVFLKEGVRDSKDVLHPERVRLGKFIRENSISYKVVKAFPDEIDSSSNLNTLEAKKCAAVVNALNSGDVLKEKVQLIVDCPSTNTAVWGETLMKFIEHKDNLVLKCEHKADVNHPSVGAASILAKVAREEEVAKIKKEFGDTGSGYPSDPFTKEFLKKRGRELGNSGIFRKSWSTWKKMFPSRGQSTLEGF